MTRLARARALAVAGWLLLAGGPVHAQEAASGSAPAVPPLSGRVVDQTGTLSAPAVAHLTQELADLEARKGSQVAVLIVPTTQPETIEQFGIRVADAWKLGRKGVDDGAILIVAKADRALRIEVGYGLEGVLPDAIAERIIDEDIRPHFRQGDFDAGVQAGIDRIVGLVNGEQMPPPPPRRTAPQLPSFVHLLPVVLIAALVISGVLRALFGHLFGSIATGGIVGVLAFLLTQALIVGLGAGLLGFLFAMFGGARSGWSSGPYGGIGGFGGGLGGGGFGGGGGGFSGGGGGFGGGGASGSW